jgi:hypothetical protein
MTFNRDRPPPFLIISFDKAINRHQLVHGLDLDTIRVQVTKLISQPAS